MKLIREFTFATIVMTLLASCGGGDNTQSSGENLSGAATGQEKNANLVTSSVLEKQYNQKAQELLELQEHYEENYENYSQKKLFEMAAEFEQGKEELESIQGQITQQAEAKNISFKTLSQVQQDYKDRAEDLVLVDQGIALIKLHKDALNIRNNVLTLIEERKVRELNTLDFRREQKFQVYETKMFVYLQRF